MAPNRVRLQTGTLWPGIVRQTRHAIECGVLHSIKTEQEIVEDNGVRFLVRSVSSLARKDEERKQQAKEPKPLNKPANPFLPYDKDLFVTDISDTHLALLNKFNVIDHHLLIVTRAFEDQEVLLTLQDFEALWACMAEFEGLGFYNGGTIAGASQAHKHLQLVPLPLAGDGPAVPIAPLIESAGIHDTIGTIPGLPFVHAFARLEPTQTGQAMTTLERYRAMLAVVGIGQIEAGGERRQSAPYNLLVTRAWMLLVPRSREFFDSISVNALGFAGSFFVRNEQQLQAVKKHGPMTVLRGVAGLALGGDQR